MTIVGQLDPTLPPPTGPGDFGGAFAAMFLVVLVVGVGGAVWKVTTARRIARKSGMDSYDAGSRPERTRAVADQLRELQQLRDEGQLTEDEYAERRRTILDSL